MLASKQHCQHKYHQETQAVRSTCPVVNSVVLTSTGTKHSASCLVMLCLNNVHCTKRRWCGLGVCVGLLCKARDTPAMGLLHGALRGTVRKPTGSLLATR